MSNKIRHSGIVESVDGCDVHVRIVQSSACSGCKVSAHCNASEMKIKKVDIRCSDAARFSVGEHVMVSTATSVGFQASLYAYIIPLLLMVATLVVVASCTTSEGIAALSSIGILIPYYIVLYLLRNKVSQKVRFEIE